MIENKRHIKKYLLPFSWLYGIVVNIRNILFDKNIFNFKSKTYPGIPIICVGNLSAGGTGKTPHIEYLIELLQTKYKVAILSRGYKRQTNHFVLANKETTYTEIGDEPFQIKWKFPDVLVAVDSDRQNGIEHLIQLPKETRPDIILMDDGFQHRWVKPSYSIILSDYNRPVYEDQLLPAGRLREPMHNLKRANMVIVTKCPEDIKPIDLRIETKSFDLFPYQHLLFSHMIYGKLKPLERTNKREIELEELKEKNILLITGIASPEPLIQKLNDYSSNIQHIAFPDHHHFSQSNIEKITNQFNEMPKEKRIVILTEKDAVRLSSATLPNELKEAMYYIPIKIQFLEEDGKKLFNKNILNHVRKNSRNSQLHKI